MLGPATPVLSAGPGHPFCHPLPAAVPGPLYIPPSNIPVLPVFCGQGCSHCKDVFPDPPQTETPHSSRALSTLTLESCLCVPSLLCLLHDPGVGFPSWLLLFLKHAGYSRAFALAESPPGTVRHSHDPFPVSIPVSSPMSPYAPSLPPLLLTSFPPVHKGLLVDHLSPCGLHTPHGNLFCFCVHSGSLRARTVVAHSNAHCPVQYTGV